MDMAPHGAPMTGFLLNLILMEACLMSAPLPPPMTVTCSMMAVSSPFSFPALLEPVSVSFAL